MNEEKNQITNDDILGQRTVKPRTIPHGYQFKQWEKHTDAFNRFVVERPDADRESFKAGWDEAFIEIYG